MAEVIKIANLSFSYPDGQKALSEVNLSIAKGEKVALVGPNGAGKSTLLLHLNGILTSDGEVEVFGEIVNGNNLREVRRRVGLVFQDPDDQLFSPTVFDDVAFGPLNLGYPDDEVRQSVKKALGWVGLSGFEGRSSHHLSLGEKKRVALATVLSMEPEVLVLDEPTANLDPRSKWALIRLLQEMPMTLVIASHDLELVRALCARAIVLDKGRIVADGKAEQILADEALLRAHGLAQDGASGR